MTQSKLTTTELDDLICDLEGDRGNVKQKQAICKIKKLLFNFAWDKVRE